MPQAIDYWNAQQQVANNSQSQVGKGLALDVSWTKTATIDVQAKPDTVRENSDKKKHEYGSYPQTRDSSFYQKKGGD